MISMGSRAIDKRGLSRGGDCDSGERVDANIEVAKSGLSFPALAERLAGALPLSMGASSKLGKANSGLRNVSSLVDRRIPLSCLAAGAGN